MNKISLFFLLFFLIFSISQHVTAAPNYHRERLQMIDAIREDVEMTSSYIKKSKLDPEVMKAMEKVLRHEFVPERQKRYAYENRPLPIGYSQTISQPYIVALMTDLLQCNSSCRVLEIGTGSGYQAAVLGELVDKVYTMEIIEALGKQAEKRLKRLGYTNIVTTIGDGYYGWKEHSPFDAIIVTASAPHVPPSLIQQLKNGGKMVIPVGSRFQIQQLLLIHKDAAGTISTQQVLPVRFVPLTGGH